MIYLLSCEKIEYGGGIYACELTKDGLFEKNKYFPCDRPMYAVRCKQGLAVLLRQPFEKDKNSGYFFIDEALKQSSEIKNTQGVVACHLSVDENVYTVNYLSGNIVKNGEIIEQRVGKSVNKTRQSEPHTHFVDFTPDGNLVVCDLGTDTLAVYDSNLKLINEEKVPLGYGIRHLTFSKDGKYIYAINEIVPSISIFKYGNGNAKIINTVKIDCKNEQANGAGIRLSNDGKYLYVSLREENVICVYLIDNENLTLLQTVNCGGDSPRDFDLVDDKMIVCNEKSGNVIVYDIENGLLRKIKNEVKLNSVLCVVK
jgi:6-phosphogluconolactonase